VEGDQVLLRAHAPAASGLSLRSPPLLPHVVTVKGERLKKSSAYKLKKRPDLLLDNTPPATPRFLNIPAKKKKTQKKA